MAKKSDTRTQAQKEQQRTTDGKAELLQCLERRLGVVTNACKDAGVSRSQYYEWKKNDPEFAAAVEEIQDVALDFVETKLFSNINLGDTSSILFYLRTKGIKRGYGDRQEIKVELPQFNDNRTEEEVQNILRERMRLYGGDGEQGKHRVV